MKRQLLRLWGALPLPHWFRWALVLLGVRKFPVGVVGVLEGGVASKKDLQKDADVIISSVRDIKVI